MFGFPPASADSPDPICEACCQAGITATARAKEAKQGPNRVNQYLTFDMSRKLPISSNGKYCRVLIVQDMFSDSWSPLFLQRKSDAPDALVAHIQHINNLSSPNKVAFVKTDGGRELVSDEMRSRLEHIGVKIQQSPPGEQCKNPAESTMKRAFRAMDSLRLRARLPTHLWPYICQHACYCHNMLNKPDGTASPHEVHTGLPSRYDPDKEPPLGCKCAAFLYAAGKSDIKSVFCTYLGRDNYCNAWIVKPFGGRLSSTYERYSYKTKFFPEVFPYTLVTTPDRPAPAQDWDDDDIDARFGGNQPTDWSTQDQYQSTGEEQDTSSIFRPVPLAQIPVSDDNDEEKSYLEPSSPNNESNLVNGLPAAIRDGARRLSGRNHASSRAEPAYMRNVTQGVSILKPPAASNCTKKTVSFATPTETNHYISLSSTLMFSQAYCLYPQRPLTDDASIHSREQHQPVQQLLETTYEYNSFTSHMEPVAGGPFAHLFNPKVDKLWEDPKSYKAMLEHPMKGYFLDAIDKEHRVWIENDVYEVVLRDSIPNDPKTGKPYRVMTTQPVFTTKLNPDMTINKFKYRLCVNGKHQNKDTQLCYESMVSIPSMRIAMDLAVRFNMDIISSDAQSFYLQAPIRDGEAYYMTLPAGWTNYDPKKYVLRLKKAVYGIPSSGQVAGRKLSNALKREGFFPTPHDPKFFFNWHSDTELSLALVHADDILWFTNARSIA